MHLPFGIIASPLPMDNKLMRMLKAPTAKPALRKSKQKQQCDTVGNFILFTKISATIFNNFKKFLINFVELID